MSISVGSTTLNLIGSAVRYTSVRFAKRKVRQFRRYHELSDMAVWRKSRGLTTNHNTFGALTNLPDYSYLDGRPVPLGRNLERRLETQRQFAEKIVQMSAEIDWAKEDYKRILQEKADAKQQIIDSKLKPKGETLIEKGRKLQKDI